MVDKPPTEAELLAEKKTRFLQNVIGETDWCIGCRRTVDLVDHHLSDTKDRILSHYECKHCGFKQSMYIEGKAPVTYEALFLKQDETVSGAQTEENN